MNHWAPIQYRDFWDIPRIFLFLYQGKCVLFDCPFDEATEDFPDYYRVYVILKPSDEDLAGSWDKLHEKATQFLGTIPTQKVRFDPSKRHEMDASVLDELMAQIGIA